MRYDPEHPVLQHEILCVFLNDSMDKVKSTSITNLLNTVFKTAIDYYTLGLYCYEWREDLTNYLNMRGDIPIVHKKYFEHTWQFEVWLEVKLYCDRLDINDPAVDGRLGNLLKYNYNQFMRNYTINV